MSYCDTYEDFTYSEDCREAITHLASFSSNDTYRRLVAATRSRIYALNEKTGNWRILADGLGGEDTYESACDTCGDVRFSSAQLGNYALFTNDFDPPLAWLFDAAPSGVNQWSAKYIEDLTIIGITKARCITAFNGFMLIGNVEIEGERKASRIYWCDYNAPLSWIPGDTSLANYQEFGLGEKILRMEPLGKWLMVYTDKAIYQGVFVQDPDRVFAFEPIYRGPNVPKFEHSLVSTGREHVYAADNGIYVLSLSNPAPVRVEWIHKASAAIYSGITDEILGGFTGLDSFGPVNMTRCKQFVGGYNPVTEEIWFSWPTDQNDCPNMSLVLNQRYGAADIVDHGFTAFCSYTPDNRPTVRDWLWEQDICNRTHSFIKEGEPDPMDGEINNPPTFLWNADENPTLPLDEDSWCSRLGDLRLEDLCDTCDVEAIFIGADAHDFTLKEFDPTVFYRERYTGSGYAQDGYSTLLQTDLADWGLPTEKLAKEVVIDYEADEQEPPSDLECDIAWASQPRCSTWTNIGSKELRCLTELSASQHQARNTRPDLVARYKTYRRGRYLGVRWHVSGVGGSACFSKLIIALNNAEARLT